MSATGHPAEIVLLDYLEGSLDGKQTDGVRRHVASCRACRRALADLSSAFDELDRLPTAQIPHDAVWGQHRRRMARWRRAAARFTPLVLAAAALLVGVLFWRPSSTTRQPPTFTPVSKFVSLPMPTVGTKAARALAAKLSKQQIVLGESPINSGGYVVLTGRDDFSAAVATITSDVRAMKITPTQIGVELVGL